MFCAVLAGCGDDSVPVGGDASVADSATDALSMDGSSPDGASGVDECAGEGEGHNCHANATCTDTADGFDCACDVGYAGDGVRCEEDAINECMGEGGGHDCHADAVCTNTVGGYECTCNPGFNGDGVSCNAVRGVSPRLFRFRVEAANPLRVYFDSSEAINGSSTVGFTVSGKEISGVTLNESSTTGHYFTVASPFSFWDNNTIRYEGGGDFADADSNALLDFTLQY